MEDDVQVDLTYREVTLLIEKLAHVMVVGPTERFDVEMLREKLEGSLPPVFEGELVDA